MAQEYARIFAALDGASTQEAVAQRAVTLAADNHAKLMFGHFAPATIAPRSSATRSRSFSEEGTSPATMR